MGQGGLGSSVNDANLNVIKLWVLQSTNNRLMFRIIPEVNLHYV